MCVVFCLGFYKKIQNPKHICVEEGLSFFSFFCLFFSFCVFFLGWTLYLVREIDARTLDDDVNDDDAGVVVVVLRAHTNAKTKGFLRRREITHITHTLSKKKKKKRILRALLSQVVVSFLFFN